MKLFKMYKLIKISIVQIKSQKFLYKLSWSNRWMFSPIFQIIKLMYQEAGSD